MDDDDVNLYDDLLINEEEDRREAEKTKTVHIAALEKDNASLKTRVEELETQNGSITKQNEILRRNISVLYKTAKAEIGRKDILLRELQRKYDEIIFRRTKTGSRFLESVSRNTDSEPINRDSVSQLKSKRKEPDSESKEDEFRPLKRLKVDKNTVETKSSVGKIYEVSNDTKVADEGVMPSKCCPISSFRQEISSKQELSDKERTLAHFAAKMGRFNDNFRVRNEKEEDRDSRKEERRSSKKDNCTTLETSSGVVSVSDVDGKPNVSSVKDDLRVKRTTKADQKSIATSCDKRFERFSDHRSSDRSQRRDSRRENMRKKSRSRSPSKQDRNERHNRTSLSFNRHRNRERR